MAGLSKEQYSDLHTTFMVLFLAAGIWHIVLNWRSIVNYLRGRTRKVKVFTPEFSLAFALTGLFAVGTLLGFFPFRQFLSVGDAVKDHWEAASGSPPWGHAELSPLDRFCRGMEDFERLEHQTPVTIDCDRALVALRDAGIEVEGPSQPLIEIARANATTPQALAEIVLTVARPLATRPGDQIQQQTDQEPFRLPYSGLGRMTMRQYAVEYGADVELALSILRNEGMDLDPDEKLRGEATRLGTDPEGLLLLLNERGGGAVPSGGRGERQDAVPGMDSGNE